MPAPYLVIPSTSDQRHADPQQAGLTHLGPFERLPSMPRAAVASVAMLRRFGPGDHLARTGQRAAHVIVVQRGAVSIDVAGAQWRNLTLDVAGPGAFIGVPALVGRDTWSSDVVALRAGAAAFLPVAHLQRLRAAEPPVHHALSLVIGEHLDRLTQRLVETSLVPLRTRLRLMLARLDELFAPEPIRVTHEQISRMLGTNRSTISELLAAEARLGLVETRRGVVRVLDPAALRASGRAS